MSTTINWQSAPIISNGLVSLSLVPSLTPCKDYCRCLRRFVRTTGAVGTSAIIVGFLYDPWVSVANTVDKLATHRTETYWVVVTAVDLVTGWADEISAQWRGQDFGSLNEQSVETSRTFDAQSKAVGYKSAEPRAS